MVQVKWFVEINLCLRFGIRSLSVSDPLYGVGENYWRGPIWINMNYLVLGALHHYASIPGPYSEQCKSTYEILRNNLIDTLWQVGFLLCTLYL